MSSEAHDQHESTPADATPAHIEAAPAATPAAPERPIRLWPVFAIFLATVAAAIASQIPIVVLIAIVTLARGGKPGDILDFVATPLGFIALAVGPQLAMLAMWWLATTFGDPRARRHRAIGPSGLSAPMLVCLLVASLAVLALGDPLSNLGVRWFGAWQNDQLFENLYDDMTWPTGLALVTFIALAPGFAEELFFRGYMQRRLLDRWPPAVVVPLVAVLFSAFHGTPAWALGVLPLALWFGVLAWRTGSLWPSIACHAFINGSVNLWRVGAAMGAWPDELSPASLYGGLALSAACLLVSLGVLFRRPSAAAAAPLMPT